MIEALPPTLHPARNPNELPAELQGMPYHIVQQTLLAEKLRAQNADNQIKRCQQYLLRQATAESDDTV